MTLGAPILAPARMQLRHRTTFAAWESDAVAMAERERKDYHVEFTTLRFRPLAEHGSWEGRTGFVPKSVTAGA